MERLLNWPPLESDPAILTELMYKLGMPQEWAFLEAFGLDEDSLEFLPKPALAAVLTFDPLKGEVISKERYDTDVTFYMKQSPPLGSSCGLIACMHSLLNNQHHIQLIEGSALDQFAKKSASMTPQERCELLETCKQVQVVHVEQAAKGQSNPVPPPTQLLKQLTGHFVAFILSEKGEVIELDGCKAGPLIITNDANPETFLKLVGKEIQRRLDEKLISDNMALAVLTPNQQ